MKPKKAITLTMKSIRIIVLVACAAYALLNLYTYLQDKDKQAILFVGDSVTDAKIDYTLRRPYSLWRYCYAYRLPIYHETLYAHGGWCRLVGEREGLNWYNCGSGGATLADNGKHNTIVKRLKTLARTRHFDYIIVSGGINDLPLNRWEGNDDTYSLHAMDNICSTLRQTGTKVGFIIPYYVGKSNMDEMQRYGDSLQAICQRHQVPFLDLRTSRVRLDTPDGIRRYGIKGTDWLHCNEEAYQILTDTICQWLKTL